MRNVKTKSITFFFKIILIVKWFWLTIITLTMMGKFVIIINGIIIFLIITLVTRLNY